MRTLLHVLLLAAISLTAKPAVEQRDYRETTAGHQTTFRSTLYREVTEHRVESQAKDEHHLVFCQPDGTTRMWTVERPGTKVVCDRDGERITVAGTVDGKPYRQTVELGKTPWLQPLSLALRVQAADGPKEQVFWMLRPDTFQPIKLKATTAGEETILVEGTALVARRVRVGAPGRIAGLWYGLYWFRASDGVFVRYEGVFGLPFVPRTVVALQPDDAAK